MNWRRSILDKYQVKLYKRAYRDIDGIYAYIASEKLSPENIIDTNGAGDSFAGGFLSQLMKGKSLDKYIYLLLWGR